MVGTWLLPVLVPLESTRGMTFWSPVPFLAFPYLPLALVNAAIEIRQKNKSVSPHHAIGSMPHQSARATSWSDSLEVSVESSTGGAA
jgi:hypothetical protein